MYSFKKLYWFFPYMQAKLMITNTSNVKLDTLHNCLFDFLTFHI